MLSILRSKDSSRSKASLILIDSSLFLYITSCITLYFVTYVDDLRVTSDITLPISPSLLLCSTTISLSLHDSSSHIPFFLMPFNIYLSSIRICPLLSTNFHSSCAILLKFNGCSKNILRFLKTHYSSWHCPAQGLHPKCNIIYGRLGWELG